MGMGLGEKAWWLAMKFESEIEELTCNRDEQHCSSPSSECSSEVLVPGNWHEDGDDWAQHVSANCLRCLQTPSLTISKLTNILSGEQLVEAEKWLLEHKEIKPDGYEEAQQYFEALHVCPEWVLQLLISKYSREQANKFSKLYLHAVQPLVSGGKLDYHSDQFLSTLCSVFNRFAETLVCNCGAPGNEQALVMSIQLYACCPTHHTQQVGTWFYPMATLPSMVICDSLILWYAGGWKVPGTEECLVVVCPSLLFEI
ncbi:hypothetical protein FRC06_006756 [Ceratobasidium sp. 370]|nr:hypothetical protein FRC06_006756 [Ceratobasidium sp. 370]